MKFSLGPILYFWEKQKVVDFYRAAAESSVDIIYLGETVCAKRRELRLEDYITIAHQLREAGKEVVLSSMTLLESPADLRELSRYCDNGEFLLEANDMGAVEILHARGLPFVAGNTLNCYNQHTLRYLIQLGMQRWVVPVELPLRWINAMMSAPEINDVRECFSSELLAFGHLPLAWSARCFSARAEGKSKDQCELCCKKYPAGRTVTSQEGETLFTINGIQTQSGYRYNLINDLFSLQGAIDIVRLSPQQTDTFLWLERFQLQAQQVAQKNPPIHFPLDKPDCNGFWHEQAGKELIFATSL
jgi:O2-independent ubiquinone biosynthesis protein UbiV